MRIALWLIAAIAIVAGLATTYGWASMQATMGYVTTRDFALARFMSGLNAPLLTIGLFAVIAALTVHAALWRRARLTPPEAPSP